MSKKKLKIHIIEITPTHSAEPIKLFVRHEDVRQARAFALDGRVTARPATQEEIIDMARAGIMPIGPFETVAVPDPTIAGQVGMFEGGANAATGIPDSELADVASLAKQ